MEDENSILPARPAPTFRRAVAPACLQAGPGGDRVEASRLPLFFRPLAALDQEQESECAGSETRSGGRLGAMEGLNERLASWRVSRLTAGILLVLCFAAGYLFAAWLSGARDTTPLAHICSRVDYVNGLQ